MSEKIAYYAVEQDFSLKKFNTFQNALNSNPSFILEERYVKTHTTYAGNYYDIYNYQFLDTNETEFCPQINNWTIHRIGPGNFRMLKESEHIIYWGAVNNVDFSDPRGEVRTIPLIFSDKHPLKKLKELSVFKSWDDNNDQLTNQQEESIPIPIVSNIESEDYEVLMKQLNELVGLETVKEKIKQLFRLAEIRKKKLEHGIKVTPSTLHMVFLGNPGTGKTTVTRLIGKLYKSIGLLSIGHTIETDRSGLVGKYVGHSAPQTKAIFESAVGGVLFIDEAYSLAQGGEADFGNEAIDTLVKLMEDYREKIVVIVAGYTGNMLRFLESNPGLESRFPTKMEFPDYGVNELKLILIKMCLEVDHKLADDVDDRFVIEKMNYLLENTSPFANARSIRNYFEQILSNQADRLFKIDKPSAELMRTIKREDFV